MTYTYKQPGNWKATRRRILLRDGNRCYRCGGPATQVDHVVPVAQGGTHADHNLGAICAPCHDVKTKAEQRAGQQRRSTRRPVEPHPNRQEGPGGQPPTRALSPSGTSSGSHAACETAPETLGLEGAL